MDGGGEFLRISYSATYFYKRILPTLIVAVYVALFLAVVQAAEANSEDLQALLFVSTGIAVWAMFVWWFSFWRCCDEVWDAKCRLVVRRGEITESIAFAEIAEIARSFAMRPERIIICLRKPNRLGSRFCFLIPYRHFPWGPPPLFTNLAHRIEQAQQPAAIDSVERTRFDGTS
jgi:hypothetical protein